VPAGLFPWKTRELCLMIPGMMRGLGVVFCCLMIQASFAVADGGSAYAAVRTARKVSGNTPLAQLTGERGEPRPQEWKLIFADPAARGGVREVVVSGDVVVSERTPLRGYAGIGTQPPIVLTRLNLNSDGAFAIANKQAVEKGLGFNWVDYTLRAQKVSGSPVWVLRLFDHMGAPVGVITISAEDGSVILPLEISSRPRTEAGRLEDSNTGKKIGGVIGTVGGFLERTGNTVKDATLRTVGTVEEVLTGDRTIGPKDDEE